MSRSDLDNFRNLYASLGIPVTVTPGDGDNLVIKIEADGEYDSGKKLIGYNGFYTEIIFDEHGKFISQGFWE